MVLVILQGKILYTAASASAWKEGWLSLTKYVGADTTKSGSLALYKDRTCKKVLQSYSLAVAAPAMKIGAAASKFGPYPRRTKKEVRVSDENSFALPGPIGAKTSQMWLCSFSQKNLDKWLNAIAEVVEAIEVALPQTLQLETEENEQSDNVSPWIKLWKSSDPPKEELKEEKDEGIHESGDESPPNEVAVDAPKTDEAKAEGSTSVTEEKKEGKEPGEKAEERKGAVATETPQSEEKLEQPQESEKKTEEGETKTEDAATTEAAAKVEVTPPTPKVEKEEEVKNQSPAEEPKAEAKDEPKTEEKAESKEAEEVKATEEKDSTNTDEPKKESTTLADSESAKGLPTVETPEVKAE